MDGGVVCMYVPTYGKEALCRNYSLKVGYKPLNYYLVVSRYDYHCESYGLYNISWLVSVEI